MSCTPYHSINIHPAPRPAYAADAGKCPFESIPRIALIASQDILYKQFQKSPENPCVYHYLLTPLHLSLLPSCIPSLLLPLLHLLLHTPAPSPHSFFP